MRYRFLLLMALAFSCRLSAQTTIVVDTLGPITVVDTIHCFNHVLHAEVSAGIIPTPSGITVDDGWSSVIPIGFTYNFYGLPNTQCIVGSNGCLGFNLGSAGGYNTWPISSSLATTGATDIRNCICGPWCDVYILAGGTIDYSMQGVAPFRNFAVTWCGTHMYSCTSEWLTTQIIIYETTGIAEVHIGHRTICSTGWNGQRAICGVINGTGAISTAAPGRDFAPVWTAANEGWRFTPAGTTYTVSSIPYSPIPYAASAVYWYDSTTGAFLGTGDLTVAPTVPTTYVAAAIGCSDTTRAYITVGLATCFHAVNNSPCEGDTLKLGGIGDSVGATYSWTGPGGFTSASQYPFRYPATLAMGGWYYVTKSIGGVVAHVDSTFVVIHPFPVVTPSSSIAPCDPITNTLSLSVNLDSAGETFSWSGPAGFSSILQTPTISPFDSTMEGTYFVTGTTIWGCKATGSIDVFPAPIPHFSFAIHHGCQSDTVIFFDDTYDASVYNWSDNNGNTLSGRDVFEIYPATNSTVYHMTLSASNAHCTATYGTDIDTRHGIKAAFWPTPDTFCLGTPITFVNNSYSTFGDSSVHVFDSSLMRSWWDFGNGASDTEWSAPYTYDACGRFYAHLTVTDSIGCSDSTVIPVYVVQLGISSFQDTMLCISMPLPMTNVFTACPTHDVLSLTPQFVWTQNMPNLSDTSIQNPTLSGLGLFVDTLTISYPTVPGPGGSFGCAIRDTVKVDAVMGAALTSVTATSTISYGGSIMLNADNEMIYYWRPDDGTLSNPNINDPIATPSVTTTYTVYGLDVNGCLDSAYVTVIVDSSMLGDVPSAFTPNHDGLNDVFHPVGMREGKLVEFRIYNRWGTELYYSNDKAKGWDGTYQGVPQDMGVYFYTVIIATPGGPNRMYKGTVTLIR